MEEISLDDNEVESFLEGGINNGGANGSINNGGFNNGGHLPYDIPNRPTTVSRRTDEYMERGYDAAHPKGKRRTHSLLVYDTPSTIHPP